MLGNKVLNPVWVVEEDLNRLKWWTLCKPFEKPVRGDWQTTCARALTRLAEPRRAAPEAGFVESEGITQLYKLAPLLSFSHTQALSQGTPA